MESLRSVGKSTKNIIINVGENSFELILRILGNEFVAIK